MIKLLLLLSFSFCSVALAEENFIKIEKSISLEKVLNLYAKQVNKNLILPKTFIDESISLYGKNKISSNKLGKFVYELLNIKSLGMIESNSTLKVVLLRDIRYAGLKNYTSIKDVPNSFEHLRYVVHLKYANASELSRNFRPFMSRYGRVIDLPSSNTLLIADSGKNILKLNELIVLLDTPSYLESKKVVKEMNNEIKDSESFNWNDFLEKKNGLFLILFSFVGLMFGYAIRGIILKKDESKWS